MKKHAYFLVLVLFSFLVFEIFFVLVREHVLEQYACSFIPDLANLSSYEIHQSVLKNGQNKQMVNLKVNGHFV